MDASRLPGGAGVYRETWGDLFYGFDYKNAHFTVLDTDQADALRSVSGEQLEWLRRDLRKTRRMAHRIVFYHRPIASLKNSGALHALFLEHKVTAVIYGHLHHYHHVKDGIPYIMTNTAA
jgi:predicted phosphohydrolase